MSSPFASLFDDLKDGAFGFNKKTLEIYSLSTVSDGQGGSSTVWTLANSIEGFIFPMTAKEAIESGRVFTGQGYKVLIKPITVANTSKLTYAGEDYNIVSVVDVAEDGSLMTLFCERATAL